MRKPQTPEKKAEIALIGKRINEIRREAGLSLNDVADRLNREYGANTNKGMISKYENGIHEPSASTVFCLSIIFGVSCDYLTGKSDVKYAPTPAQGIDTTGYCLKVFDSLTDRDEGVQNEDITAIIPKDWLVGGREFFALHINGRRFAPRYYDGDVVIFERKIKTKKGQTALVSIGGEEAILCTITKKRDGKYIQPLDPALETKFYTTEELANIPVKILGASVEIRRQDYDNL